jgi:hypothetical protein
MVLVLGFMVEYHNIIMATTAPLPPTTNERYYLSPAKTSDSLSLPPKKQLGLSRQNTATTTRTMTMTTTTTMDGAD